MTFLVKYLQNLHSAMGGIILKMELHSPNLFFLLLILTLLEEKETYRRQGCFYEQIRVKYSTVLHICRLKTTVSFPENNERSHM